ncbi:unnamed protein product [Camellia sinensis]
MGMKLYGIPASTCTARVIACLYEKGVDFELIPVNMGAEPFGQIPALEDGDLTLFESRAITAYIAEKYKDTSYDLIRHKNLKEAAQVKVWLEVESQQFNPPISAIVFQCFFAPMYGMKTDQAVVDANVEKLGKVLDVYEGRLAKSKYLAGDFYSLADLHHLSFTHYLFKTPYASVFNERPRVKSWWEDISSRPVFKKISPAMSFGDK